MAASMASFIWGFLCSTPGTACCLGAIASLGWAAVVRLGLRRQPLDDKDDTAAVHGPGQQSGTSSRRSARFVTLASITACVAALACIIIMLWASDFDGNCPSSADGNHWAELGDQKDSQQSLTPSTASTAVHGQQSNSTFTPSELLAQARLAMKFKSSTNKVQNALKACAWHPSLTEANLTESPLLATELQSQLVCFRELVEFGLLEQEEAPLILGRSHQIFKAVLLQEDQESETTVASGVEWARISHTIFQQRCKGVTNQLQELRQVKAGQQNAERVLSTFRNLASLEHTYPRERFARTSSLTAELHSTAKGTSQPPENPPTAGACLVNAVREARLLAANLPSRSRFSKRPSRCISGFLERIEAFALEQAERAQDGESIFNLGLYWSELAVAGRGSSSSRHWVSDAKGWHVPEQIARAERFLLNGEQATMGSARGERGALRALRLYQHAKFLALEHHDAAAEWRFQAAAELAASNRRRKLAAHCLARLSYFVYLRGRHRDALSFATAALAHSSDPFANYLQATLRRSLDELRTKEDIGVAERQIHDAVGHLPSQGLEQQRASAEQELVLWRAAAEGGFDKCFALVDVARVLLCFLCKAVMH